MSITENSWFLRVFLAAWLGLKQAGANSVLGRALDRVGEWFCLQAKNSVIWNALWREGAALAGQHCLPCVHGHPEHPLRTGKMDLPTGAGHLGGQPVLPPHRRAGRRHIFFCGRVPAGDAGGAPFPLEQCLRLCRRGRPFGPVRDRQRLPAWSWTGWGPI